MEIFNLMDPTLRVFWYVAIPVSIIFLLQLVAAFIGMGDTDIGLESDSLIEPDSDGSYFSLRNMINFLMGFSWFGISFFYMIKSKPLLIALAISSGLIFVITFFYITKQILKLAHDGSVNYKDSIGTHATVYRAIPGRNRGTGKITFSISGSHHELEAITRGKTLKYGTTVKITQLLQGNIVIVEEIK